MKNTIFRIVIIAAILTAGFIAVYNVPETVESFLPRVETLTMIETEFHKTVSGIGIINKVSDDWYVTVSVNESDIRRVELGQSALLSGAAFDDGIYTATVSQIDSSAVQQQGDYAFETVVGVTLQIDNPGDSGSEGGGLRSGYTARAEIKTDETRTIFILPYSVICQDNTEEFVYILSGNSAVRRNIITGAELADGVQILEGLNTYDEVIASPESITDGQLIKNKETSDNE